MKKTIFIVTCIALISSCSPKHRYDKLIRKYPQLIESDTVIVRDTIIREIRVPVPEYRDSFIVTHDTVIETEKLIITRKGDFFGVTVKPDTITYRDTIPYEVKVPGRIAYIDKVNWWYLVISFLIGIIVSLFIKK